MRRANDFYPTPSWATEHMVQTVPFDLRGRVFEPCAGDWDIANALPNLWIYTNDIDRAKRQDSHRDMTLAQSWREIQEEWFTPDWVITNPPFNAAPHILPLALEHCTKGVIALLRISYSEPCENRARWLWENQDRQSILYLPRRVSFTGDGATDSVATAWFIWGKAERLAPAFIYPTVDVQQMAFAI